MKTLRQDTYEDVRTTIALLAAKDFANHSIIKRGTFEYRCGDPDSSINHFNVILRPGKIIFYGDVGDFILSHSDKDSLGWLSRASREYLIGKIVAGKNERFYKDNALNYLESSIADGCSVAIKVKEELRYNDFLNSHEWAKAWFEHGDSDYPKMEYPCERALWLFEALSWFIKHLPKEEFPDNSDRG